MISTTDIAPFAGTVGGGFLAGLITGWAIKKVLKLAAIIIGLFIAALAYLEYHRIVNVDWDRIIPEWIYLGSECNHTYLYYFWDATCRCI